MILLYNCDRSLPILFKQGLRQKKYIAVSNPICLVIRSRLRMGTFFSWTTENRYQLEFRYLHHQKHSFKGHFLTVHLFSSATLTYNAVAIKLNQTPK